MMRVEVPGNLLLFGEYAVTQPGVKGIAIAVEPRLVVETDFELVESLVITGVFEGGSYTWSVNDEMSYRETPQKLSLVEVVAGNVRACYGKLPRILIKIDSTAFSYSDGTKRGLGSSAAVAGGLSYVLISTILGRPADLLKEVFPLALKSHREFQGGRGSGYDVMTSLFGGVGVFCGGVVPTWEPISLDRFGVNIQLIRGDAAVVTAGAVSRFHDFLMRSPKFAKAFLGLSTELAELFINAKTEKERYLIFDRASKMNRWIGRKLGIPSEGPELVKEMELYRNQGYPVKALGSGGEIAAALCPVPLRECHETLVIANEGLRCRWVQNVGNNNVKDENVKDKNLSNENVKDENLSNENVKDENVG